MLLNAVTLEGKVRRLHESSVSANGMAMKISDLLTQLSFLEEHYSDLNALALKLDTDQFGAAPGVRAHGLLPARLDVRPSATG